MLSRLFGQFLLQEQLVTASQLARAFVLMEETRPLLGVLAMAGGQMTPEQVKEVHEAQKRSDRRFGQIAVEKGYLSVEALETLLSQQQSRHLLLGQILIEKGIFSSEGFLKALEAYREASGLSAASYAAFDREDIDGVVASLFTGQGGGQELLENYVALFVRNVIRFVDPGVAIDPLADAAPSGLPAFRQVFSGDRDLTSLLSGETAVLLDLARRYSHLELPTFDETAEAAVGEFLNLVNGLFTVNCSDIGIELDMSPPEPVGIKDPLRRRKPAVIAPLRLPEGILRVSLIG